MQQPSHNRKHEVNRQKQPTPIEKLLREKIELREKCRVQEKKLREDFAYIQDNASSLLLSGVSTLLFPSRNAAKKNGKPASQTGGRGGKLTVGGSDAAGNSDTTGDALAAKHTPIAVADLFALSKTLLPVVWEIAQPMLITWGIRKASALFFGLFSNKKK